MKQGIIFYKKINNNIIDRRDILYCLLSYWNKNIIANKTWKEKKWINFKEIRRF